MKGWKWERKKEKSAIYEAVYGRGLGGVGGGGGGNLHVHIFFVVDFLWPVQFLLLGKSKWSSDSQLDQTHFWYRGTPLTPMCGCDRKERSGTLSRPTPLRSSTSPSGRQWTARVACAKTLASTTSLSPTSMDLTAPPSASLCLVSIDYICVYPLLLLLSLCPCFKYLFGWFYVSGSPMKVPLKKYLVGWLVLCK